MTPLVAGLVLFLGLHSVRIVAEPWRESVIARIGRNPWRALYSIVSLAGFALLVWGYGQARLDPIVVWSPPAWTRYVTSLLVLPAFVLIVAGNMRGTRIKAAVGHPMLLGTIRDQQTKARRPFVRFFACEQDLSHDDPDTPLPPEVEQGKEPFMVVGAIAGGSFVDSSILERITAL